MLTRLGLDGIPRGIYGSFAGKVGGGGPELTLQIVMYYRRMMAWN